MIMNCMVESPFLDVGRGRLDSTDARRFILSSAHDNRKKSRMAAGWKNTPQQPRKKSHRNGPVSWHVPTTPALVAHVQRPLSSQVVLHSSLLPPPQSLVQCLGSRGCALSPTSPAVPSYAGMIFDLTGAAVAHAVVGEPTSPLPDGRGAKNRAFQAGRASVLLCSFVCPLFESRFPADHRRWRSPDEDGGGRTGVRWPGGGGVSSPSGALAAREAFIT
jgi:hypothetical protein